MVVPVTGLLLFPAQRTGRLPAVGRRQRLGQADAEIAKLDGKLNNEAFVAKAKPEVVEEQRERRAEADAVRVKLADAVKRISA